MVPGALGVLACLMSLVSARRPRHHQSPSALRTWGFALFLCGAWLSVFPVVWPLVRGAYFLAASPSMTLANWMGYASGPGIILSAFGAYVIGRAGRAKVSQKIPTTKQHRDVARDVSDPLPSMDEMHSKNVSF